jgi:hypothetical protein
VVTSAGIVPARSARVKNRRAARQITPGGEQHVDDLAVLVDGSVQIDPSAGTLTCVSSPNQRSPGACARNRATSMNSGVNRWTHQ